MRVHDEAFSYYWHTPSRSYVLHENSYNKIHSLSVSLWVSEHLSSHHCEHVCHILTRATSSSSVCCDVSTYSVQPVRLLGLWLLHGGGQELIPLVVFVELRQRLPGLKVGAVQVVRRVLLGLFLI